MAILSNLVVNGSSRFLNHVYMNDLSVAGTTSFTSISASEAISAGGNITAGGCLYSTTGSLYLKNLLAMNGRTDNWLGINSTGAFTSGTYFGNTIVRTDGTLQVGSGGTYFKSNSTATTIKNLVAPVGAITELKSTNISTENIRWIKAEEITVADLGGTFIVAPTIYFTEGDTKVTINNISGKTVTMSIICPAITTANLGGHTWKQYSKVKLSGGIGGCVLGSSDGYLSAQLNTTANTANVIATIENAGALTKGTTYQGADVKNLAMMMYAVGNGSVTNTYKVGMVLTSYGDNYRSYLDIYSGGSNDSVTRVGNLGGLTYKGTTLDNQWGLMTTNGYFSGKVNATSGTIGGWTLDENWMFSSSNAPANNNVFMMPSGTRNTYSVGGSSLAGWVFTSSTTFGVNKNGGVYATVGKIGGWTLDSNSLQTGTWGTENGVILCTGTSTAKSIGGSANTVSGWTFTSGAKFGVTKQGVVYGSDVHLTGEITASSGTIGGISLDNNYGLYTNSKTAANSSKDGFLISKDGAIYLGAYNTTNQTCPFQVTSDGKLTAISGKIGGWTISRFGLSYAGATPDSTSVVLIPGGTNSSNSIGGSSGSKTWIFTAKNVFGIDDAGKMFCNGGQIAGWTIGAKQLYNGTLAADNSMYLATENLGSNTTIAGRSGSDWRFTVGSNFGITNTGAAYASNLVVGPSNGYHATADSNGFKIYNNTTQLSNFGSSITLGRTDSTNRNIYIDSNGISIRSGTTVLSNFATEITLGRVASGYRNILIDPNGGVSIRNNTTTIANFSDTITLGDLSSKFGSSIGLSGAQFNVALGQKPFFYVGAKRDQTIADDGLVQTLYELGNLDAYTYYDYIDGEKYYLIDTIPQYAIVIEVENEGVLVPFVERASNNNTKTIYAKLTSGSCSLSYFSYGPIYLSFGINDYTNNNPGIFSSTFGGGCVSSGDYSSTIGIDCTASGKYSIACGRKCEASGNGSFATGQYSHATGSSSIAMGSHVYSTSGGCLTIGKYNEVTSTTSNGTTSYDAGDYAFIIGNGDNPGSSGTVRSNALTVDWNGVVRAKNVGNIQSATKTAAVSSSNTIDGTPAVGAQLTLDPGTYLICGRFVFGTASTTGTRNNQVAIYRGASPTNSTVINHSITRVMAAANNWASLTTTTIVTHTSSTTYTVGGTSSRPENGSGGESAIYAVRLL